MKKFFLPIIAAALSACTACSKDSGDLGGSMHDLKGNLFIQFAGEVSVYNLTDNKFTENVAEVSVSDLLETYDISWDARKVLFTLDVLPRNYDVKRIVYRDINASVVGRDVRSDGNNMRDFLYEWGSISSLHAFISPNEQYIALQGQGFSDMPTIVIASDRDQELGRCNPSGVGYHEWGKPVWAADNTLYVRNGDAVYRMRPSNNFQPEKLFNVLNGSSRYSVNPQGTKFVFRMNKHLYMCNIDGSGVTQITKGTTYDWADWDGEDHPTFSPDGKYIAFTARASRGMAWSDHDYPDGSWVGVVGGKYGYVAVIPADGNLYDLDNKNSGAISLTQQGNHGIPHNGHLVWR